MKKISFVFSRAPYGVSLGREGLDMLLSISITNDKILIFFIGDGIFQLIKKQQSEKILYVNYLSTFKILSLFDLKSFYFCNESLIERGFFKKSDFLLDVSILTLSEIHNKLNNSDVIINF